MLESVGRARGAGNVVNKVLQKFRPRRGAEPRQLFLTALARGAHDPRMMNLLHHFLARHWRTALAVLLLALFAGGPSMGTVYAQPMADADPGQRMRLTPEQRRELWERMTPEQRERWRAARSLEERQRIWGDIPARQRHEIWDQLSPEQRELMLRRVPPEQRQDLWRRMTPQEREAMRQRFIERRGERGSENQVAREPRTRHRLSPEERHRLREQIEEARRDDYRRPERKGGRR